MEWTYGLLALVTVLCVYIVSRSLKHSKKHEALLKLPGYRPRFLVGNLYEFGFLKLKNRRRVISDVHYARLGASSIYHKEGLYIAWGGPRPIVCITRAWTAEVILSSQVLIEKSRLYTIWAEAVGSGLINSTGDQWRQDRKSMTPAFHFRVLNDFLEAMNDHSRILVDVLKKKSEGKEWLDPQEAMNNCVLDILLDTSADFHLKAQTECSEYVDVIERMLDMITKRLYSPWFHSNIYYLFPEGRNFWKLTQYAHRVTYEKIQDLISKFNDKERSSTGSKRKILLDILLEQQMTWKELRDQAITFVTAGHHTVGNSLCWLMYLLGLHKDIQSKLFNEICEVFPGGDVQNVTKEHLTALKYMDCVIKECQRLYTTVPDVARLLSEDTVIGEYIIPAGTDCMISIAAIHRDPDVYPDPERFDPDRFLPENSAGRSQYAFIPFSAGPRNCIGQRYAIMKMKVILCHVISKLKIHSLDPEDKVLLVPEIVSKPLDPLRIVFEPRYLAD